MSTVFTKIHPFLGVEFDWVSTDNVGHLGYFSTAGFGPVPDICVSSSEDFDQFFGDLYESLTAMPILSEAQQVGAFESNVYDWMEISRRGLFAFDWFSETSTYQLIGIPECPLMKESIKNELSPLFSKIILDCDFFNRRGNEELLTFNV